MRRLGWISFGLFAQLLFAFMVPQLFLFLNRGGGNLLGLEPASWRDPPVPDSIPVAVLIDLTLLLQFGVWHSLFLLPGVRDRLEHWMPGELYGSLYTIVASTSLLAVCWGWQPLPGVVYETSGVVAWGLLGAFLASWVMLVYSISLTGLGWQTGMTPLWSYIRQESPPRRRFLTTGLYGWLRHPVYLSFLGLIWFTPRMTTDRALVFVVWTLYVFAGSVLKDRRLIFYIGDRYRAYAANVPGYPFMPAGPLARQGQEVRPRSEMIDR